MRNDGAIDDEDDTHERLLVSLICEISTLPFQGLSIWTLKAAYNQTNWEF